MGVTDIQVVEATHGLPTRIFASDTSGTRLYLDLLRVAVTFSFTGTLHTVTIGAEKTHTRKKVFDCPITQLYRNERLDSLMACAADSVCDLLSFKGW